MLQHKNKKSLCAVCGGNGCFFLTCYRCFGIGRSTEFCQMCFGKGIIENNDKIEIVCKMCKGKKLEKCQVCMGKGYFSRLICYNCFVRN